MAKYVAQPIGTGFGAQSNLNQNFEDIEDNFQRVLYRDGSSPNQMEANIDMNGFTIYNAGSVSADSMTINGQLVVANQTFVTELPDPVGQDGKFVRSDGAAASWQFIAKTDIDGLAAIQVDTLADLKTLSGIVNGALVTTKERSTGKGGGGTYEYDDSLAVFDEFVNVASTALPGGYVLRDAKKNILQAGADLTGASDSSAAFDRADIGENIYVPAGTYDFTSAVTCTVDGTLFYGDGGYASIITKSFNGIPLTFEGDSSGIVGIGIEGDGANFTGGGVKLKGYNNVAKMCRINDTADSCVLFDAAVGTNVGSGTYAVVEDCFLLPTNTGTTYSIRSIGTDDSTRPTVRTFRNISGGGPGPDFSGMNRAILADSFCTIIKFDANSSKIQIHGNRFTNSATNLTVLGSDHDIDGNIWGFGAAFGITIDATCANVHWGPNNPIVKGASTLQSPTIGATIGGAQANNIHTNLVDYKAQFEWKGTTTDGTFGNSTYSVYYKLTGRHCYMSFSLLRGSTATNATGTWQFRLPFKAFVTSTGTALVKSSTGTYNPAVFEVQGGSSLAVLYLPASTAAMTDASIAFGTGGLIEATLNFLVSPT